ncbi:MAG: glycosyltransferase, partial [Oscillospiraceae bacterium]
MVKISVCMIVRNEQAVLARCLDCVKHFADELIIVDTGSSDKTKEIAGQYTDYVYDFLWVDDFSAARNYSYSFATGDYIMWVDADDV